MHDSTKSEGIHGNFRRVATTRHRHTAGSVVQNTEIKYQNLSAFYTKGWEEWQQTSMELIARTQRQTDNCTSAHSWNRDWHMMPPQSDPDK